MNKNVAYIFQVILAVICFSLPSMAQEQKLLRVGIVAPDDGTLSLLGTQLRAGFYIHEQQFIDNPPTFEFVEEAEICEPEAGADIAYSLEEARVDVVVGFFCVESLSAALPVLQQINVPVININIRSDIVRDEAARLDLPLFSLAPRASDQAKFASRYIIDNWGDKSVALIEDGTISNRELADAIRLQLDDGGFQPIVLDNFRPGQEKQFGLVRRLGQSKITHVFVGGSRLDTSIMARDAASIGLEFTFAGGDALRAADEGLKLPNGTIAILPDIKMSGDNAIAARAAFDSAGIFPDRFPILGYATAEIMNQLAQVNDDDLSESLKSTEFKTIIGPVTFNQFGERQESVFNAMIWQDGRFVEEVSN
ncbi:ABC transporter substrate-binding protein [Lentilitoribacter sp. Alg239-R112]|uniref:ABC transporter substrate-binding protein n=1 Tax=Lentilitoribacter sp. Alg239-R112 TaxID=2305987 RepID=UPI0013A6E9CB|nr:ABC transporter substrate-binding protein [Lentilitoribacter sp. Alg239-R112]